MVIAQRVYKTACAKNSMSATRSEIYEAGFVPTDSQRAVIENHDGDLQVIACAGSGKTESFLYPIIDRCLRMRDAEDPDGVVAVLVYPMNALAADQRDRLRVLLAGTGITYGMYVGSTPRRPSDSVRL